ncbi:MAG: hypothetical protein ACOX62_11875 [Christensenellales bacterium]
MSKFSFRGLEMHSSRMWQWNAICTTLAFMNQVGLNALILHQNDIMDELVMPSFYFNDSDMVWNRWPIRRSKTYANSVYVSRVVDLAKSLGIDVYLEVKEIWYPEGILELQHDLRDTQGVICPSNPFWFSFLEKKTQEVFDTIPGLAGLIVSPATRESKVSIATRTCTCNRCKILADESWYKQYIQAVYEPLRVRGKTLVVRDFSYTIDQQSALIDAVITCSKNIIMAIKNVPHDFWPTFPHNPRIGNVAGLRQWIEFDVWGQYAGMGLFPCGLAEDLQTRIQFCYQHGAEGIICRTDWEICNDASTFNSFNMLNLFAGAMLSMDPYMDLNQVYQAWTRYGLLSSLHGESEALEPVVPSHPDAWIKLRDFMRESWKILEKTLYVRGNVFQLSSKIQYTIDDIFYTMTKHHSKSNWDKKDENSLALTPNNIRIILNEKKEALQRVKQLSSLLSPCTLGLPEAFVKEIEDLLKLYELYVEQFYHAAHVTFLGVFCEEGGDITDFQHANQELELFCERLQEHLTDTHYPYYVYWLLDTKMISHFVQDNSSRIKKLLERKDGGLHG